MVSKVLERTIRYTGRVPRWSPIACLNEVIAGQSCPNNNCGYQQNGYSSDPWKLLMNRANQGILTHKCCTELKLPIFVRVPVNLLLERFLEAVRGYWQRLFDLHVCRHIEPSECQVWQLSRQTIRGQIP